VFCVLKCFLILLLFSLFTYKKQWLLLIVVGLALEAAILCGGLICKRGVVTVHNNDE
jgi:hypothetical protein